MARCSYGFSATSYVTVSAKCSAPGTLPSIVKCLSSRPRVRQNLTAPQVYHEVDRFQMQLSKWSTEQAASGLSVCFASIVRFIFSLCDVGCASCVVGQLVQISLFVWLPLKKTKGRTINYKYLLVLAKSIAC